MVSARDSITAAASTEHTQGIQYSILMVPSPAWVPKAVVGGGVPQTL